MSSPRVHAAPCEDHAPGYDPVGCYGHVPIPEVPAEGACFLHQGGLAGHSGQPSSLDWNGCPLCGSSGNCVLRPGTDAIGSRTPSAELDRPGVVCPPAVLRAFRPGCPNGAREWSPGLRRSRRYPGFGRPSIEPNPNGGVESDHGRGGDSATPLGLTGGGVRSSRVAPLLFRGTTLRFNT
jgi:hypothetical protein